MKGDNLKRHHDTHNQNKEFADEYPPGSNIGKEKKLPSWNKQKYKDESMVDFRMHYVPDISYSTISLWPKKILTCFESTYVCESAFSMMGNIIQ